MIWFKTGMISCGAEESFFPLNGHASLPDGVCNCRNCRTGVYCRTELQTPSGTKDIDIPDSTPVLDLRPYVPIFDARKAERTGWVETRTDKLGKTQDDGRFAR